MVYGSDRQKRKQYIIFYYICIAVDRFAFQAQALLLRSHPKRKALSFSTSIVLGYDCPSSLAILGSVKGGSQEWDSMPDQEVANNENARKFAQLEELFKKALR